MAIANYSDLKTAIENWLNRSDLTNRIPEFITLAEAHIDRELRIRAMETRATLDTVASQQYYALPSGYKSMRHIRLSTSPVVDLEYLSPEMLDYRFASGTTAMPTHYTVVGDELKLGAIPDAVYTMEMTYFKRFDALSDGNTTNWLTDNAPDLLLYASLAAAEVYLKNDPRLPMFIQMRDQIIESIKRENQLDRFGGSAMQVQGDTWKP
jgi:hypothetical protein